MMNRRALLASILSAGAAATIAAIARPSQEVETFPPTVRKPEYLKSNTGKASKLEVAPNPDTLERRFQFPTPKPRVPLHEPPVSILEIPEKAPESAHPKPKRTRKYRRRRRRSRRK